VKKTLSYGLKSFQIAWEANGFAAIILVFSKIYENTLFPFIQVFLLARLLDILGKEGHVTLTQIAWIVGSYLIGAILKLTLTTYVDSKNSYQEIKTDSYLDLKINKKLTELDPATFESPEFQGLLSQMNSVKGSFQAQLDRFIGFVNYIAQFITASIVVSATFPIFVPFILVASIPSFLVWNKFRKVTWPYYVEKRTFLVRVTQYIKDLLSMDSTSKEAAIFNTGPVLLNKVGKERNSYLTAFGKVVNPTVPVLILARLVQFGVFVYTQYVNLMAVLGGALGIGQFTLVFQQTLSLATSAEEILNMYSSMAVRNKYLDKYFDFLATEKKIRNSDNTKELPEVPTPALIEFKDVSFKYPKTKRDILKNFNLKIGSGEKIALVGENGAGKTTLIKLLLRFYDVTDGEVLINGLNIKNVDLEKWRSTVGALFQDFIKYQFTFKENVFFGNTKESENTKLLDESIEKSGAKGFLEDLPKKYDQVVGKMFKGGIDLSGGQWQKLALARAFYRNAPILILDEPTSAIDAKAEYEIFQKVQSLQKDKTVIIISHRFSTVRNADRILVLEGGRIVEEGNHNQLMDKKGLYEELFTLQAQGYK
jgi:ATP-binding cassette subfamily B protein